MGILVDNGPGPNFRQTDKPSEVGQGNVWYNPTSNRTSMADGVDYWGMIPVGVAGYISDGGGLSSIDKMLFSIESISSISSNIGSAGGHGGAVHASTAGYVMGTYYGNNGVWKVTFSTDATSSVATMVLGGARTSTCESGLAGYSGGTTQIQKLLFSGEAISSITSTMGANHEDGGAVQANYIYGYFFSGQTSGTYLDRLTFSSEVITSTANGLGRDSYRATESSSAGYGFGYTSAVVDKLLFSTEVWSVLVSTLAAAIEDAAGMASSSRGYCCGGVGAATTANRITFSSDSIASISSVLSASRVGPSAFENPN